MSAVRMPPSKYCKLSVINVITTPRPIIRQKELKKEEIRGSCNPKGINKAILPAILIKEKMEEG